MIPSDSVASFLVAGWLASSSLASAAQDPCAPGPECGVVRGSDVKVYFDLPYGPGGCAERQCLNVFEPDLVAPCAPTVVWIHGGGWTEDDSNLAKDAPFVLDMAAHLAESGIPVVACNYFLSEFDPCSTSGGEHDHVQAIKDVKSVLAWIRDPANPFQLPTRIVVAGTSAGGHLAAMLAATQGPMETFYDPGDGDYSVCMAILYSPPLDFVRMGCVGIPASPACRTQCGIPGPTCEPCHPYIRRGAIAPGYPCIGDDGACFDSSFQEAFLGRKWNANSLRLRKNGITYVYDCNTYPKNPVMPTQNPWYDASPLFWVSGDEPPIVIHHARCDAYVSAAESEAFRDRMILTGGTCVLHLYEPAGADDCFDQACRHSAESLGTFQMISNQIRYYVEHPL